MLGAGNLNKKWVFTVRFVDTQIARPRWRMTGDYQLTPRLQIGGEYNPAIGEIGFRGSWQALLETPRTPLVAFGTSSDRIGTPEGTQQYSVTLAKSITNTPVSPFFSVTYSEFERGLVFPFGASMSLGHQWSFIGLNDGRKTHALLNFQQPDYFVSFGYIWLRRPSVTVGWGF